MPTMPTAAAVNLALMPDWLDAERIIDAFGPYVVPALVIMVFAECGILAGFFIPAGDSLLFTAGLMIGAGKIDAPLWLTCLLLVIAACAGNWLGYIIGRRIGPALFNKPDSRFFKQEYVDKTHQFFEKYGARAIILARFVPIVRTFITAIAGVGKMDFRKYMLYSTIGGVLWAGCIPILGYFLGGVELIRENVEAAVLLIVAISFIPIVVEVLKHRLETRRAAAAPASASASAETDPEVDSKV